VNADTEPAVEAISKLIPAILRALHAMEFAARHLSPANLPQLAEAVAGRGGDLNEALTVSQTLIWPERLQPVRDCLERAAAIAGEGISALAAAGESPEPVFAAYRALRGYARACESIYPMAAHMRSVSQFFLEAPARDDPALSARLQAIDPALVEVGVMHFGGEAGTRGGFSLYVPEHHDPRRAMPLVVAMHGGSGNGGAFLWSWLREARTRELAVIAPTAIGSTWSLMEPDVDRTNIDQMLDYVAGRWKIDMSRLLLTGMSDGGTFSWVLGVRGDCRFTHLAPFAASFHPMLITFADAARVRGLPVYLVHGAQDWMFPAEMARTARQALEQLGALVTYREIADLAHTYPRDENSALLDWFLGTNPLA